MSEFEEKQAALVKARKQRQQSRRELFAAQERQRKIRKIRSGLSRRAGDKQTNARIEELDKEDQALATTIGLLQQRADRDRQMEQGALEAFIPFSDPTEEIARLDGRYPILLFPVRLETRFKEISADNQRINQLWVRIYPDDIAVDTFEEMLAEVEVSNARIYWTNIWKAGGVEEEKRAAWQSLVKSHGAGRAYWIINQVKPTNPADEPVKAEGDFILVVVSEEPLPAAEKPAVQTYWQAVWLADNDQQKLAAAMAELVQDVGQQRAEEINAGYSPQNLSTRPADESSVTNVRVEFLELPKAEDLPTQQQPWMHGANTAVLPERFVLLGYNNGEETLRLMGNPVPSELKVGPSPSAAPEEQIRLEDDELVVPDEMQWLVDFDKAVANGMGFKVNLSALQARRGFDRLFVLGVRLSADIRESKTQLETLIEHHQISRKGFSLLPQGAPTNNVEDKESGYTWRSDADLSYDHYFLQDPADDPQDWRLRKDGRWLAELLGVDADLLKASPNYFATDQCEARAMNMALWPATLGHFMEQLMEPVFDDGTIESTRAYFNRYVVGRGTIPAVRVGKQPYGILPATPFSRMAWLNRKILGDDRFNTHIPNQFSFLPRLYALILKADETWKTLQTDVSYVGKAGVDPQQALLDVVGLHPSSVEFYQRYAETLEQLYNRFKYSGVWGQFIAAIVALAYVASGTELLAELGYDAQESGIPEILNKFFLKSANLLKGPVIDDQPLSETDAVRAYLDDGSNYIQWLITAARDSHDTLRMQQGFTDNRRPTALLYLMLHHALDKSYLDTSFQLHLSANVYTNEQVLQARKQPSFIHIQEAQQDHGSLWQHLYKTEPAITGSPTLTVERYIAQTLTVLNPYLNQQLDALEHLKDVPTARLERVFTEHLDCCSYRLDAWWLGLVNVQLGLMRDVVASDESLPQGGSYLGAFGWLEDVRPEHKSLETVDLEEELQVIFNKPGEPELQRDSGNFGYIHAPSLNHAVTAAVLRNGYLSNATPENPQSLAINLTSERVRLAMGVIEGIRNGQSLAALLGYQFERGLHDQENLFLDALIFDFRKQFPLAGNRMNDTKTEDDTVSIQAIEARNVVDGLALVEHVQAQPEANQTYPFGLGDKLPQATDTAQLDAINAQVQRIMNINDAVADLAMAESVYQVVQGNYDRAAGTLEAFSKGNFPPTPDVVQTPRSGVTLTHRVGLQLQAGLNPADPANSTPRAKAEPAINKWLQDLLPTADRIFCEVEFFDHASNTLRNEPLTQVQLGLLPIDLLYMVNMDRQQQMQALDDCILFHVIDTFAPRPDAQITIKYNVREDGKFSFFELAPYLKNLRALILQSRPLRSTDIRLPNEADKAEENAASINPLKVTTVRDLLVPHSTALDTLYSDITTLLADTDPEVVAANAVDNIDDVIATYQNITDAIARFGLPSATVAFTYDWRRQQYGDLIRKLDNFINGWDEHLADFDQRIIDYGALDPATPDADKFQFLLSAAQLIWTATFTALPGNPDQLRDDLLNTTRVAFVAVLDALKAIRDTSNTVSELYKAIDNKTGDIALHDVTGIDLEVNKTAIVAFMQELQAKTQSFSKDIAGRLAQANTLITGDATADAAKRIEELTGAVRQLLNEDFVILPEFELTAEQSTEWQNAWDNQDQLLQYQLVEEGVDFPVDDWLYGAARVRGKLHHLESAIMFGQAFIDMDVPLRPLQFPFRENDSWLGLKFPDIISATNEPFVIDEDKLLYTAHYHQDFDSNDARHCGLLLDEWSEVIPTTEETTGLTFHYDRPNTEPPQTLLLATAADFTGHWNWQDLVDTLHETLDMAKKRAVEPQHVDNTAYARFLPALLSQVATWPITSTLNFAYNNAIQYTLDQ